MDHSKECNCDRCLLKHMQAADAEERQRGWESWYRRDSATLLTYMQRRCRMQSCLELSEDLLHDCFVIAFQNVSNGRYVDQGKSLCAYLYGIARHLLYESARVQRREVNLPEGEDQEIADSTIDLADRLWVVEVLAKIKEICEMQPVLARSVVAELYTGGKSTEEVALVLDKSAGNIRAIAHRTVNGIVRDMEREGISLTTQAVRSCLKELAHFDAP